MQSDAEAAEGEIQHEIQPGQRGENQQPVHLRKKEADGRQQRQQQAERRASQPDGDECDEQTRQRKARHGELPALKCGEKRQDGIVKADFSGDPERGGSFHVISSSPYITHRLVSENTCRRRSAFCPAALSAGVTTM